MSTRDSTAVARPLASSATAASGLEGLRRNSARYPIRAPLPVRPRPLENSPRHRRRFLILKMLLPGLLLMLASLATATTATASYPFSGPGGGQTPIVSNPDSPLKSLVQNVGIDQRLDQQLPADLKFVDDQGQPVRLGDYFGGPPIILTLVYFECPMLCNQVLTGLLRTTQAIPQEMGRDYRVLTVSFDPRETPALAAKKKARYVRQYRREGAAQGWHFLTGTSESITALTDAIGFRYQFDPKSDQFAHASGIVVLTPDGRISRYFYGIDYEPTDLRLGLVESSAGRIGSAVEQVLLLCFHYDPLTGRYGLAIARLLQASCILTLLILGTFIWRSLRDERQRNNRLRLQTATVSPGVTPPSGDPLLQAEINPHDEA